MATYILQKDLPYIKAGMKYAKKKMFHYTGDDISYYPVDEQFHNIQYRIYGEFVENNFEWFIEQEENVLYKIQAAKDLLYEHGFLGKFKFTEEDMRKCFERARELATPYIGSGYFIKDFDAYLSTLK